MATTSASLEERPASPAAFPSKCESGDEVWNRVWQHKPSDAKDDALLLRERKSHRWELLTGHIEATLGPISGLKTIELGSGRGDLSVLLAQHGADVTLLDHSDIALNEARARFERLGLTANYEQGDLLDLTRLSGRYDLSLSSGVVEHFLGDDRTRTVGAHLNVLRPQGMAMVSVPNARCMPYRLWKSYLEFRGWWPYGMEAPYSARELSRRAASAGFHRIETQSVGFWQSIGDHILGNLFKYKVDWSCSRSILDNIMGLNLLLFAWRGPQKEACSYAHSSKPSGESSGS